jgi:hypothetical protein
MDAPGGSGRGAATGGGEVTAGGNHGAQAGGSFDPNEMRIFLIHNAE